MANERRIVELVLKATGDAELQRITREMQAMNKAAQETTKQLQSLNKSFLGVSAATAGLWVGNKIQEGFQALVSTVSDAITEMNELAESGEAAGSSLNQAAIGGAVEFSKAMEAVSTEIDKAVKELVGGFAPAMTTLVTLFGEAIGSGDDFTDTGREIGQMLIDVVKFFAQASATIDAYSKAFSFAGDTLSQTILAFRAALSGDLGLADMWMKAAKASSEAASIFARNAQAIGQASANAIQATHNASLAAADNYRPGAGGGKAGGGRSGGSGRSAAQATEEETRALVDYSETMRLVTEGIAAQAGATAALVEENNARLEQIGILNRAEESRKQAEADQAEAVQKAQEQWGFLADAMGQATYDIISGTESIGRSVKKMVASIIADLTRLLAQKAIMQLLGISDFGQAGSSIIGKLFGSAAGNAFGAGGVITGPTLHGMRGGGIGIAGEAGPEAIMPLARNAQGQLGVVSAGGGVQVVVNNNSRADIGVRETDQGIQIDVIERQLADRIRRGGTSLPAAVENTYRNGRFASAY